MPTKVNTACAAATENLSRVVTFTFRLRVHWKGVFSVSGSNMIAGGHSSAHRWMASCSVAGDLDMSKHLGGLGLVEAAEAVIE